MVGGAATQTHSSGCGLQDDGTGALAIAISPSVPSKRRGSGQGLGSFTRPGLPNRRIDSTPSVLSGPQGELSARQPRGEFENRELLVQRRDARLPGRRAYQSPALRQLAVASKRLGVPGMAEAEAARVYLEASDAGLFIGRRLAVGIGASLYCACRRHAVPRTLSEAAEAAGTRHSDVGRVFKALQRRNRLALPGITASSFLARYAHELGLSPRVRSAVEEMLAAARDEPELSSQAPHRLVAALIYVASEQKNEGQAFAVVARACSETEVTLRLTVKLLERVRRYRRWSVRTPSG